MGDITEKKDWEFLADLFKHHPNAKDKGVQKSENLIISWGESSKFKSVCFYISHLINGHWTKQLDISYIKCIENLNLEFGWKAKDVQLYLMNSDLIFE